MRFLINERSPNKKTGPIMVTTSEATTCPNACPLKAGGCYAKGGPLAILWRNLTNAAADADHIPNGKVGKIKLHDFQGLLAAISRQSGKLWRMNQAGDLPGDGDSIDTEALQAIVSANRHADAKGFTYTHKPVAASGPHHANAVAVAHANVNGFTVNLSADNLTDADRKADLNIGPVACVLPAEQTSNTVTPAGRKVVVCPATIRDDVSCATCGLCQRQREFIIGFPAHGAAKRKASAIAAG